MQTTIFIHGALPADLLTGFIGQYKTEITAGAYSCFMGQVRADKVADQEVKSIEFTAYTEMADIKMREIKEQMLTRYEISGLEVRHSLGNVEVGEICLFVLTVGGHRKSVIESCNHLVERVKSELPIWGKEMFAEEGYKWKINK